MGIVMEKSEGPLQVIRRTFMFVITHSDFILVDLIFLLVLLALMTVTFGFSSALDRKRLDVLTSMFKSSNLLDQYYRHL